MIKKLSTNIVIYGVINGLRSLVPFIMVPILTAYLTSEEYGVLSLIEVLVLLLVPFISLNISSAINVAYFKLKREELTVYISTALLLTLMALVLANVFFILFGTTISESFQIPYKYILWVSIFAFLKVMDTVVLVIYQASQQPVKYGYFTIVQSLLDLVLSYLFVVILQYGVDGRFGGSYISFFLMTIVGFIILRKQEYIGKYFSYEYARDILKFGLPLIPHVVGGVIIAMSDRFFISHYIGNDEVGYYAIAYQMGSIMLLFSMSINQAWIPMLFGMLKNNDTNIHKNKKVFYGTVLLFVLFIFIFIMIFLLSNIIFDIFVDEKFYKAKEYFPYLLLAFLFQSLYFLFANFLFYEKLTTVLAKITFTNAVVNIILNYVFIKQYGIIGVAYATAITFGLFLIMVVYRVYKMDFIDIEKYQK